MSEYLRSFAKTAIALFCVWHMAAIGIYSIPGDSQATVATWLRNNALPRVSHYVLLSSQWQQWNLFAPNPLRRIVFYRVERLGGDGQWTTVARLDRWYYPAWRHAVRFKLLGQALEENTGRPQLAERAAQVFCREMDFAPGDAVRIWHEVAIIPYVHPSPSKAWWDSWEPTYEDDLAIDTVCAA